MSDGFEVRRSARELYVRLPMDPKLLRRARHELHAFLREAGIGQHEVDDLVLAAGEALANAVEHPLHPGADTVELHASVGDDGVAEITVRDFGRWRPPKAHTRRGRGTTLMQAFAQYEARPSPEGTTVVLRSRND